MYFGSKSEWKQNLVFVYETTSGFGDALNFNFKAANAKQMISWFYYGL